MCDLYCGITVLITQVQVITVPGPTRVPGVTAQVCTKRNTAKILEVLLPGTPLPVCVVVAGNTLALVSWAYRRWVVLLMSSLPLARKFISMADRAMAIGRLSVSAIAKLSCAARFPVKSWSGIDSAILLRSGMKRGGRM